MYNHNKAQQSKNRVHISWDILYSRFIAQKKNTMLYTTQQWQEEFRYISIKAWA